ncbi:MULTISPECIES: PH domain-containing protein [Microbispora]|uniref:PH domain-containing protein n=2 Tax=Microbispora TaxID=2005 RepID=A0ABY3LYL4_9ACTN|nr:MULTISPECIES: PH domain-containing protein [Microbispora]MBO4272282.1 PH domain-containing protein [Microbispora triticiradicis]TLP53125.1 PH domain-containing protein [Microbispora fusca]TYB60025.1 PH domain-containing protein [Microbispora tritici]
MPEGVPSLPVTWRPRSTTIIAYGLAGVMVGGAIVLAVGLPEQFKLPDRLGMVGFGLLVAFVLHLLGRLRVRADERGITVVNPLRVHRFEWAEVLDVTMVEGDPWPKLDLANGLSLGAMGIQSTERERSRRAVAQLTALIRERGEAPDHL